MYMSWSILSGTNLAHIWHPPSTNSQRSALQPLHIVNLEVNFFLRILEKFYLERLLLLRLSHPPGASFSKISLRMNLPYKIPVELTFEKFCLPHLCHPPDANFLKVGPATHCSTLQHTAAHCSTLQNTATHCSTIQHTATHCNTLQHPNSIECCRVL